jgi:prepilin-type N-terminal cleavage/methylation domain-containing protein
MMRIRRLSAGFSLLEMLIVVAVLLAIAALAVPNMMSTISNYRLRGAASNIAGIVQTMRMRAIHDNRIYTLRTGTWNGARLAYVDLNGNGSFDSTTPEPSVQFPTGVSLVAGWGPSITSMQLGYTPQNPGTVAPTFGFMGLPCVMVSGICKTTINGYPVGFVIFVTDTRGAWAASTVSPAARVRTWLWSGSSWQSF